jgi:hypothetical protein
MLTATLKKQIEKIGIEIEVKERFCTDLLTGEKSRCDPKYIAKGTNYYLEWYDQAGYAACVYVCRNGLRDDCRSDYFPGWFPKTVKSAVKALQE